MGHPYSTIDDLQQAFGGAARLTQATDWDRTRSPNTLVIDNAIEDADALIDSYVNKQRFVPLEIVPVTIKWLSARIARYRLSVPRGMVDEVIRDEHERDMKWLEALRDGSIVLGVDPQPQASSLRIDAQTTRPTTKDVSRQKLKGFS